MNKNRLIKIKQKEIHKLELNFELCEGSQTYFSYYFTANIVLFPN